MIVIYLIQSYLLTILLQLPGFTIFNILIKKYKLKTQDWFWGISRSITLLIIGLLVFISAHFFQFINNNYFLFFLIFSINIFSILYFFKNKQYFIKIIKNNWKIFLTEELIFIFFLIFLTTFRSIKGDILDLEKFMDFGFIQSYLKETKLPLKDMWLANEKVNYYTFGHFLCSILIRLINVPANFGYNLCLALVMALTATNVFSLVINTITKSKKIFLPVFSSFLVSFGGNSHFIFYWIKNKTFQGFWYPNSTRYIHNTIHEFPSYSFIVSDLHAHLINLPFIFIFLIFCFYWIKNLLKTNKINLILTSIIGLLLGIFIMTNTWDFIIYSLVLGLSGFFILFRKGNLKTFTLLIKEALLVIIIALATAAIWLFNFQSISQGPRLLIVDEVASSPLFEFLELWFLQLFFLTIALFINNVNKKKPKVFINVLITASLILLTIPEIIYFKDIYPDHPRANTMFKFTYQAFCLMQILTIGVLNQIAFKFKNHLFKFLLFPLFFTISLITLSYSYFGYRDYYGFHFSKISKENLSGQAWQKQDDLDDYNLIKFLNENENNRVNIVEAVGESYSTHARVSVFTGLPTILGWRVHEWLWRGGFSIPSQRTSEVAMIYEMPLGDKTKKLLKQYNIKYIIVGDKEKNTYSKINHQDLQQLGEIIYTSNSNNKKIGSYILLSKFYEN